MPVKKSLLLVISIALCVLTKTAEAQYYNNTYREDSWHVTVGPDFFALINPNNQPVDRLTTTSSGTSKLGYTNYSRVGIGATVHAEYYPNPFVGLTLGTGIAYIPAKLPKNASDYTLVPFKLGVKGFFSQTMYLSAETGLGYMSPSLRNSHMAKLVAPEIGYNDNNSGWDINLRYEVIHGSGSYLSMFGLHIAYSFDLSPSY